MIHEHAVRDRLAAFASGALALDDFADWVDRESWSMHRDSHPGAIRLASAILAQLAEHDARAINSEELRNRLVSLLNNVSVSAQAPVQPSASMSLWVRPQGRWVLPAAV